MNRYVYTFSIKGIELGESTKKRNEVLFMLLENEKKAFRGEIEKLKADRKQSEDSNVKVLITAEIDELNAITNKRLPK